MNRYDSKLFYGMELGNLTDILLACRKFTAIPPHPPRSFIEEVDWINTQLPEGVFLEVTYPCRQCPESEMIAHVNLFDNYISLSKQEMYEAIRAVNYAGYGWVIGNLGLTYKEPMFYTRHYVYH
jgi:hypothetical protein